MSNVKINPLPNMANKKSNLVWIDLEMTGLDVENDFIIEIATVVTDIDLNIIAEGPVLAVSQTQATLDAMDDWNQHHHGRSGLIDRVLQSTYDASLAENETLEFLRQHVEAGRSPMCGNSICQDRRFLHRYMPSLEGFFHYRHLDVTTLKILAQYWAPDLSKRHQKKSTHQALADIKDSIAELAFYRQHLFNL